MQVTAVYVLPRFKDIFYVIKREKSPTTKCLNRQSLERLDFINNLKKNLKFTKFNPLQWASNFIEEDELMRYLTPELTDKNASIDMLGIHAVNMGKVKDPEHSMKYLTNMPKEDIIEVNI